MNPRRRFVIESVILLVLSVLFTFLSIRNQWTASLDDLVYDTYINWYKAPRIQDIVIVSIDDTSLFKHGPWPWSRALQARLISRVNQHQPELVGIDVIYAGTTAEDKPLVAAAKTVPALALPLMIERTGAHQQHVEVLPFPDLLDQADLLGHVHVEMEVDAIVRGTYLYQGIGTPHWPHLMQRIANRVGGQPDGKLATLTSSCTLNPQKPGAQPGGYMLASKCGYVRIPFAGPPGTYPQVPADMLLSPQPAQQALVRQALENKIVLIGLTATGVGDWVTSPSSTSGIDAGPMSGVEFNANLLSALLTNSLIYLPSIWWPIVLACLISSACSLLLPRLRPKQMLGATVLLTAIPVCTTLVCLHLFNAYLPLVSASIAVLVIYPLWSWRRHEIAWSFIEEELNRIEDENRQWQALASWHQKTPDPGTVADQLSFMLSTPITAAHLTDAQAPGRNVARPDLPPAGAALLADAMENTRPLQAEPGRPGEILAAQIRTLQDRAREVREGRAIGLAGLGRMANGVLIISALGEIRFVNAAAGRLLLKDQATIDNLPPLQELLKLIQPPLGKSWQDIMQEVVLNQQPVAFEGIVHRVPLYVAAEPLSTQRWTNHPRMEAPSPYAPYWVLTLSDLTAIRSAQAQREEALAFLSHDIRSPLHSVLALIKGSQQNSDLLEKISRYTQKGLSTSDQFLQLSRLQLQGDFERYDVELSQVVHNAVEQSFFQAREKQIEIKLEGLLDPVTDEHWEGIWLSANGELLERAIDNLLGNAIKYSRPNTRITLSLTTRDEWAYLVIADQGYGIPRDEIDHIFEPYFRSRVQELAENRGAGLGLRLVKTVVDRHGGTIAVQSRQESRQGSGTTFTLRLPLLPESA